MTLGLTIPGVETVHAREVWVEPCYPVVGPALAIGGVRTPVAHYSAAASTPDGDIGEHEYQIVPWLQAVNRDYWLHRAGSGVTVCGRRLPGYAVGYSFAVDWLGGVWELRGFDIQPAANSGHNTTTAPLLFITDGAEPATDLAWRSARAVWREFRRRSGRSDFANRPVGHGSLAGAATECPGAGIRSQLAAGYGDLDRQEDDMITALNIRALDTRTHRGPLAPGETIRVMPPAGLPQGTRAVWATITIIDPAQDGFVTVWDGAGARPPTSALNYRAHEPTVNGYPLIGLSGYGTFDLFSLGGGHVVVDITGAAG